MKLPRRALLLAPLLALSGETQAQPKPLVVPLSWYVVQVEDNAFTVEMPGVPDHRVLGDRSARGTPFALHSYSLDAGGFAYVAQTALYPGDVDVSQPRAILQVALNDRAQQLETRKWSRVDWRQVPRATAAVESIGPVRGGEALRQLIALQGRRFVSIALLGNAAGLNANEGERFFKSLKLA